MTENKTETSEMEENTEGPDEAGAKFLIFYYHCLLHFYSTEQKL